MNPELEIIKPEPIAISTDALPYKRGSDALHAIRVLESGNYVLISEFFSNGLSMLKELRSYLDKKLPNKSFQEQREYRSAYHTLSNRFLIEIKDHKLAVKKAPLIGWFEKLYPEINNFLLPFPQVQGLNSSWQWYKNGISIPVLRNKLHPFYGTYFPTRFEHLILFDNWLKRYQGPKKAAMDIGIGSGVLSLQMVKYGFQKVFATDINPNAIIGLTEYMGDTKLSRKIELDFGSLFAGWKKQTELIVFNPPWLPESHNPGMVDDAIYYNKNLFPDFFTAAKQKLLSDGKLVIIFSNIARISNVTKEHPIEKELNESNRFQLEKCWKKSVKASSVKTKRDQNWRSSEEVELWVLTHKPEQEL